MIELKDISKIYQVGEVEVRALDHVSMYVDDGEFVAVIGPSGSGKSTMMNIVGCLDVADEGEYLLDGQTIENYSEAEITRIRGEKIGFIFQGFNLIGTMTAYENVELPLLYQRVPKAERAQRIIDALERWGWHRAPSIGPRNFPAASSSAWPSPEPSPRSHRSIWLTSPRATWIRTRVPKSWTCSTACTKAEQPSCSSRMTTTLPRRLRALSACSMATCWMTNPCRLPRRLTL